MLIRPQILQLKIFCSVGRKFYTIIKFYSLNQEEFLYICMQFSACKETKYKIFSVGIRTNKYSLKYMQYLPFTKMLVLTVGSFLPSRPSNSLVIAKQCNN